MDTLQLRNALGQFATGVCLITVNDGQTGALALTANSFASVSLEPPLVLWSIQNRSERYREYTECEYFGISVLSADQADLSNYYARREHHVITTGEFNTDRFGIPQLTSAVANFSLRLYASHAGGDHRIVLGEVLEFAASGGAPLLFHSGQYRGVDTSGYVE